MPDPIPVDAYALIIGAMKCGTSSLYDYLKGHPEICPAVTKEPEFFSEHQNHKRHIERYEDLWPFDAGVHRYALEASTGYTKYPEEPNVASNIHACGIRPKFIYLVRNPFDRIASHYNFMQKNETWGLDVTHPHLINTSNYYLQLAQYRKWFPREDLLVLDFADLTADPRRVLERTYDFLGLAHSYFPEEYAVRNPTQMKSRTEKRLKGSKISPLFRFVPKPLKRGVKRLLRRTAVPAKRVLTDGERRAIFAALREDMARLHSEYGIDVQRWGFDA